MMTRFHSRQSQSIEQVSVVSITSRVMHGRRFEKRAFLEKTLLSQKKLRSNQTKTLSCHFL